MREKSETEKVAVRLGFESRWKFADGLGLMKVLSGGVVILKSKWRWVVGECDGSDVDEW